MPDPIPDTPENIMRAVVNTLPKDEWRYLTEDDPAEPAEITPEPW